MGYSSVSVGRQPPELADMDLIAVNRVALAASLILVWLLLILVPMRRMRRLNGTSGYVADRASTSVHRLAIQGLRVITTAAFLWCVTYVLWGPARMALWESHPWLARTGWCLVALGFALVGIS